MSEAEAAVRRNGGFMLSCSGDLPRCILQRRCVIPAGGFYEWRGPKTQREPVWIHPADGALLLFAGLYDSWQAKPSEWQRTFTIITTSANGLIRPIHDRMPVILDERAAEDWMS